MTEEGIPWLMTKNQAAEHAKPIARLLGERERPAIAQIERFIRLIGPEAAQQVLQQTQQVEADGGMLLPSENRRRTPGGVFFYLARESLTPEQRRIIFPMKGKGKKKPAAGSSTAAQPAPQELDLPSWAELKPVIKESLAEKGLATVKITLIGRPGRVIDKGQFVLTSMQSKPAPALPKGLPTPPATQTTYTVYIAAKQWRGVAEAIQNPDDVLIAEGYPVYDPELEGMAVFVSSVKTKLQQAAQRQSKTEE